MTDSIFLHDLNAASPISVNPSMNFTETRFSQPSKADFPIFLTLEGIVMDSNFSHFLNASSPISVTPSIIVTDASFSQPLKADFPIFFTLEGIVIDSIPVVFSYSQKAKSQIWSGWDMSICLFSGPISSI